MIWLAVLRKLLLGMMQAVSEMDGAKFSKLFKDTKTFTKTFTPTDADLTFAKV